MGHLSQFMPISNEEKYDLIETQSLKERSLKFMDYLVKQKKPLNYNLRWQRNFLKRQIKIIENQY